MGCLKLSPIGKVNLAITLHGKTVLGAKNCTDDYRFGFNGMEKDNEVKGSVNSVNYKYRMEDTRLGRFFAVDPLTAKYPHNSPYAFSENRVIDGIELEGLEVLLIGKQAQAGILFSGIVEGGIMIAPDGIYGYGSYAGGLVSNINASSSVSFTYFPTMPSSKFAAGTGTSVGVSGGELGDASLNAVQSSGYWGVNATLGVGGAALPGDVSGYISYTNIKPISELANKNTVKQALVQTREYIDNKINEVSKEKEAAKKEKGYNEKLDGPTYDNKLNDYILQRKKVDEGIKKIDAEIAKEKKEG